MPKAATKTDERQSLPAQRFDLTRTSSLTLRFVGKSGALLFKYRAWIATKITTDSPDYCQSVIDVERRKGRPPVMLLITQTNQLNPEGESLVEHIPLYNENGKRRQLDISIIGRKGTELFKIELCGEGGDDLAYVLICDKKGDAVYSFFIEATD